MQYPVSAQYAPLAGLGGMLSGRVTRIYKPQERPTTKECRRCGAVLPFSDFRILDETAHSHKRKRSKDCPACESKGSRQEQALAALYEALGDQKLTAPQLSTLTGVDATTVRARMWLLIAKKLILRSEKMPYLYSRVQA